MYYYEKTVCLAIPFSQYAEINMPTSLQIIEQLKKQRSFAFSK